MIQNCVFCIILEYVYAHMQVNREVRKIDPQIGQCLLASIKHVAFIFKANKQYDNHTTADSHSGYHWDKPLVGCRKPGSVGSAPRIPFGRLLAEHSLLQSQHLIREHGLRCLLLFI